MNVFVRIFAFICQICPLCFVARRFPESKFALGMKQLSKICPFCLAYKEMKKDTKS
jgi:hypothetical protein